MSGKLPRMSAQLVESPRATAVERARALRWGTINAGLFALFAYDLSAKCPGHTSVLHCVEAVLALALLANALLHARRLTAGGPKSSPPPAPTSPPRGPPEPEILSVSLSPRWRSEPTPPESPAPSPPRAETASPDYFIADRRGLADYLRAYESRTGEAGGGSPPPASPPAARPPVYQLAVLDSESGTTEEGAGAGAGEAGSGEARSHLVWRRLQLDPQNLDTYTYNLRLWLHLTIFSRLARELEREAPAVPEQVQHYLRPFADQEYVISRIKELASGGCLSAYRWDGGSSDWATRAGRPTDSELVLQLLATYLDAQLDGAFSARHLSSPPAPPPRGPRALALRRITVRPPHWALQLGDEALEPAKGRNNMLHAVLLLLCAAARADPPSLRTLHLGPAGLNMLWVIGR